MSGKGQGKKKDQKFSQPGEFGTEKPKDTPVKGATPPAEPKKEENKDKKEENEETVDSKPEAENTPEEEEEMIKELKSLKVTGHFTGSIAVVKGKGIEFYAKKVKKLLNNWFDFPSYVAAANPEEDDERLPDFFRLLKCIKRVPLKPKDMKEEVLQVWLTQYESWKNKTYEQSTPYASTLQDAIWVAQFLKDRGFTEPVSGGAIAFAYHKELLLIFTENRNMYPKYPAMFYAAVNYMPFELKLLVQEASIRLTWAKLVLQWITAKLGIDVTSEIFGKDKVHVTKMFAAKKELFKDLEPINLEENDYWEDGLLTLPDEGFVLDDKTIWIAANIAYVVAPMDLLQARNLRMRSKNGQAVFLNAEEKKWIRGYMDEMLAMFGKKLPKDVTLKANGDESKAKIRASQWWIDSWNAVKGLRNLVDITRRVIASSGANLEPQFIAMYEKRIGRTKGQVQVKYGDLSI